MTTVIFVPPLVTCVTHECQPSAKVVQLGTGSPSFAAIAALAALSAADIEASTPRVPPDWRETDTLPAESAS